MVPPWLHRAGIHNPPEAWTPKAVAVLTDEEKEEGEGRIQGTCYVHL